MASTWSSLKFELIGTGEQSGTWGTTTNANLGDAIEQAIGGKADITMSSTSETLTLTDTTNLQNARALYLNLSGTPGGAATLNVPAVEKAYIVNNGTNQQVTVKVTGQTGVVVPVGKVMALYDNGTDVVDTITHLTSLTLGSALPVASGGTGQTSYTDGQLLIGNTSGNTLSKATLTAGTGVSVTNGNGSITLANTGVTSAVAGTGVSVSGPTGAVTFTNTGVTSLSAGTGISVSGSTGGVTVSATNNGTVTSVGGTGSVQGLTLTGTVTSSGNLTLGGSLSAVDLTSQVTGALPVANGGTGATSAPTALSNLGAYAASNPSGYAPGTVTSVATSGSVNGLTLSGGPITTSGTVTLGGGINASTISTGTLGVGYGGTGLTTVGTSGNVLTSNGSAWVSQAVAAGGANIQTFSAGGTYTKPPGAKFVYVEMWGAGGGGASFLPGSSSSGRGGGGGGGGSYVYKTFAAPVVGATETITIGAGGAAGSPSPSEPATQAGKGGTTNFGTLLFSYGGNGGSSSGGAGGGMYGPYGGNTSIIKSTARNPSSFFETALVNTDSPSRITSTTMGFYVGGSGGNSDPPNSAESQNGRISIFGGGGGGGGGAGSPAPQPQEGGDGGLGRMFGAPSSVAQSTVNSYTSPGIGGYIGGGGGAGAPSGAYPSSATAGNDFNGGGGGRGAQTPGGNGLPSAAGGMAGGGGGGGGSGPTGGIAGAGAAGGNGYVVVYTWG